MNKAKQKEVNAIVLESIDKCCNDVTPYDSFTRLRHCQAWVRENERYVILQSYNTIVAYVDKHTMEMFDFLRYVYGYTATSAQHIAKFRSDYGRHCKLYTYYPV